MNFLQEYYNSYNPKSYRRQYDFLRSAVKVEPKIKGNKVTTSVFIDTDYMDNYYNATGSQVAQWANQSLHFAGAAAFRTRQGLHGGLNTGSNTPHVWNDTMKTTIENGELLNLAIDYLKSKGFSVRN